MRGRSRFEVHVLLRAITFVAISFRLLHKVELFAAVVDTVNDGIQIESQERRPEWKIMPATSNDLMRLCSHLLQTHEDGSVDFSKTPMRRFLLDSEVLDTRSCHEVMTKTCLQHIQQSESRSILRPSKSFWRRLTEFGANPFLNYARRYWPRHYRVAETEDNDLPTQLHDMVELAVVAEHPKEQGYLNIEIRQMTLDACLQLSLFHGFEILEKLCRRAGADENSETQIFGIIPSDCTPLCSRHFSTRFDRPDTPQLIPSRMKKDQATVLGIASNSATFFSAQNPSWDIEPAISSADGWVLVRSGELEQPCEKTLSKGLCVGCLADRFEHIAIYEVPSNHPSPSEHAAGDLTPVSHVGAESPPELTRATNASTSPSPDPETPPAESVYQCFHSMSEWDFMDERDG